MTDIDFCLTIIYTQNARPRQDSNHPLQFHDVDTRNTMRTDTNDVLDAHL